MSLTSDVCCIGREPTEDERRGIIWWNHLSAKARMFWLDRAWRDNEKVAGRKSYSLDDLPSAADAWRCYKDSIANSAPVPPRSHPTFCQDRVGKGAGAGEHER